ncbi:CinA family protein [Spiribacter halobius]|uniref:Damage-inducible protein CinA n=1 Tax=Sediminicurvatus halobius TaxID=2182432 RepID=A0A2U2MZL4_9GAMM|nr:nicotinamide-nucleotide amidohydrolase family protein [Spiribacter halobius]PWG62431.1 damage-inducible protein CinA [Spiribacter halobius]UEX79534.1 nicotinamide-nucleotide amidohydrolase family protein [Spiribacter halobius]
MTADDEGLVVLARDAGQRLRMAGLRLVTAESCTGGWIAKTVTDVPGSSRWFEHGLVTYSNEAKTRLLGVEPALLSEHGAVSDAVARAMARGAVAGAADTVAVAVTGVAGPEGGTPDKPVGLVWLAWADGAGRVASYCGRFEGDRMAVRRQSVVAALQGLCTFLD